MTRAGPTLRACGIRIGASTLADPADAVNEIRQQIGAEGIQQLLVLFGNSYDSGALCAALDEAFQDIPFSGCTTAGEIGPDGMRESSIVVIAFPVDGFRIAAEIIEGVAEFGVERATNTVRKLRANIVNGHGASARERVFALLLVDGLSNLEETLIAAINYAINYAIGDVQLVGGSAADSLSFEKTTLIYNGRTVSSAAVLLMVDSAFPFRAFKTQNFEPTETKLVVTGADPERRIVHELNAEVAAQEYARVIGLLPEDLGPFSFASYPLVVRVGDEYYCRSIRNMNADGSLSFFCAIDEGLVFTVADPHDMIATSEAIFEGIESDLGSIDLAIGFDCILRRLDAENRQIRHHLEEVYRKFGLVGFHTYGEQYNAMHLNQTLTGIAFGGTRFVA